MTKVFYRELVSLSNHCDFLAGYSFKSSRFSHSPEDVPLVKGENLGHREIDWMKAVRWPASEAKDFEKFELNPGDVVLAMDRPIVQGRLKFSWIRNHEPRALLVQRVARLRGYNGLETDFLRYLVASPAFQAHIETITTGVNVPHISGKNILSYSFGLPTLATQQRIAEILSNYDCLIDNNNRRIAMLEESIHLLYKEWFVRLCFPGYESVKIIDGIPEGWSKVPATQVIDFNPKTSAPKGEVRPYLPMEAVSTNSMIISEIDTRPVGGEAKFKNGDTLLARITPCLENGKTAFVQFMEDDNMVATGSTEFIVMRSTQVTPYWVYCLARSHNFRQHAINSMAGSDGRQRVKPDCFEQYQVLSPPPQILKKFDTIASPIFKQIKYLSWQNQKLKEARDLLLPRLINGSITV